MTAKQDFMRVVIVGGGSAGWMSAAFLSRMLGKNYDITLIESEDIGTIGVGEATIPAMKTFNSLLNLDELDFIKNTQASFKLGIRFFDWYEKGHDYYHGFGRIGRDLEHLRLHQYWLKMYKEGKVGDLRPYSINTVAPDYNKFMFPDARLKDSPLSEIAYAYHLDANLYARYLRKYSENKGVKRIEGKVIKVNQNPETGYITDIDLERGENVKGDLFIDCTGFRGVLIEETLNTGYEDWSKWLFCDRAIAVPCTSSENFTPYTISKALDAGWQWRIPLQHRTGNGHVYSSAHLDDGRAEEILLNNLDGEIKAEPFRLKFNVGRRKKLWNKNCVAIGLSGGFLEPLESTGLYMIQSGLVRLIRFFPDNKFQQANIDEFNRLGVYEFERIRDFIVLHYNATMREDTPFWKMVKNAEIPDSLKAKTELFLANGRVFRECEELFAEESWIQVFLGQGVIPNNYDPLVNNKTEDEILKYLGNTKEVIQKCASKMPSHKEFIDRFCRAETV